MVGASGAIYGILVAFTILFPDFKVQLIFLPVPVAAKYFVPVLLMIDLLAGFTGMVNFWNEHRAFRAHRRSGSRPNSSVVVDAREPTLSSL